MRLLVWNMAAGFGYDPERHARAWEFVQRYDPDVALLQEAVLPPWATERWPFVLGSRRYALERGRSDVAWGSAIVARDSRIKALVPTEDTPSLRKLWGAVVVAATEGPAPQWLASIHSNAYPLPPDAVTSDKVAGVLRCDPKAIWEIEVIADELALVFGSGRFTAGGDLNSGLLFDTRYPRKVAEDKLLVWGASEQGELLQVVFVLDEDGSIFVLHARPLTDREKRRYRRHAR